MMEAMRFEPARSSSDNDRIGMDSAVLARLIEEVRNDVTGAPTAYNRMHNRHNR
jgi:hypothetical protein